MCIWSHTHVLCIENQEIDNSNFQKNEFRKNPISNKGKSNMKNGLKNKCSQFDPKNEAHSFNPNVENPCANNPFLETGKNFFFENFFFFKKISVHSLIVKNP